MTTAENDWRRVVSDPDTPDATLLALAGGTDVDPEALAVLAADEARLRRIPAIAGAIYRNPRASMSIANRVIATCRRLGVVPEEIPGFEDLAAEIGNGETALDAHEPGLAQGHHHAPAVVERAKTTPRSLTRQAENTQNREYIRVRFQPSAHCATGARAWCADGHRASRQAPGDGGSCG
jgi:hypothetical protein